MFMHTHSQNTQGCADLSFPKLEKFGKLVRSIFAIPHLFSEFLKLWKRKVLLLAQEFSLLEVFLDFLIPFFLILIFLICWNL